MDQALLPALTLHWRYEYDLSTAKRRLNALTQFRADIDSFGVHTSCSRARSAARALAGKQWLALSVVE